MIRVLRILELSSATASPSTLNLVVSVTSARPCLLTLVNTHNGTMAPLYVEHPYNGSFTRERGLYPKEYSE